MEDFSGGGFNYNLGTAWDAITNRGQKKEGEGTVLSPTATANPMHQAMLEEVRIMDLRSAAIDKVSTAMLGLKDIINRMDTQTIMLGTFGENLVLVGNQAANITTVKDSLVELVKATSTQEAFRSTGVITTMAAQMGKLDDKMNDWDKGELSALSSVTKSLGQMSGGGGIGGGGDEQTELLKEIKEYFRKDAEATMHRYSNELKMIQKLKEVKTAIKESSPYVTQ
jgi:hypothetical protein